MIVMDFKADNFYAFKNFHINMAYPKKIVNSYISNEHLKDYPNFRYKKVNVIMGGNASGKTTFGKLLMKTFNTIDKKQISFLTDVVNNKSSDASLSIDFILSSIESNYELYRLEIKIPALDEEINDYRNIDIKIYKTYIKKTDSYEQCILKLEKIETENNESYINVLEKIEDRLAWYFRYPSDSEGVTFNQKDDTYLNILKATLKTLDSSILDVVKLQDVKDAYIIKTKYHDIILQEGEAVKSNLLSSGTYNGIGISDVLFSIIKAGNEFYYCDEKFSYIHSEVEKAFFGTMINHLSDDNQLFFTTHNADILDMPLPKHSFTFLKKELMNEDYVISCINASDYLKRNTDSLRNAVENDLFSVMPDVSLLDSLENLKIED